MSRPIDEAQAILTRKGLALSEDDFREMQDLFLLVPIEEWDEVMRLMEGVSIIVSDPLYEGDIEPIE